VIWDYSNDDWVDLDSHRTALLIKTTPNVYGCLKRQGTATPAHSLSHPVPDWPARSIASQRRKLLEVHELFGDVATSYPRPARH